jgi:hypothetical protein
MSLVTVSPLGTIAKSGERMANETRSRNIDVSVAACILRAVAAKEISAGRYPMVCWVVREVAILASRAGSLRKEVFANGDAGWVVFIPA